MVASWFLNLFLCITYLPKPIFHLGSLVFTYLHMLLCFLKSEKKNIYLPKLKVGFSFHHFLTALFTFVHLKLLFQTPFEIKSGEEEHGTYRYCQTMVYNNVKMDFPIFLWPLVCTKACWIPLKVSSVMTIMILNFWLAAQNRWSQLIVLVHL